MTFVDVYLLMSYFAIGWTAGGLRSKYKLRGGPVVLVMIGVVYCWRYCVLTIVNNHG